MPLLGVAIVRSRVPAVAEAVVAAAAEVASAISKRTFEIFSSQFAYFLVVASTDT